MLKFDYGVNKDVPNVALTKAQVLVNGEAVKTITPNASMKPPNYQSEAVTFEATDEDVVFTFKSLSIAKSPWGVVLDNIRLELADD